MIYSCIGNNRYHSFGTSGKKPTCNNYRSLCTHKSIGNYYIVRNRNIRLNRELSSNKNISRNDALHTPGSNPSSNSCNSHNRNFRYYLQTDLSLALY